MKTGKIPRVFIAQFNIHDVMIVGEEPDIWITLTIASVLELILMGSAQSVLGAVLVSPLSQSRLDKWNKEMTLSSITMYVLFYAICYQC